MAVSAITSEPEYRPGLPAAAVHGALQSALREWQRAEKCAVLWFGEVQRRQLFRELGYSSIQQYATSALGFSASRTRQFVRLADALGRLPQLRRDLSEGKIGWTKARVVARMATPATESRWLEAARSRSRAALEDKATAVRARARRMRAEAGQGALAMAAGSASIPDADGGWAEDDELAADLPVRTTLSFTPLQYARFEALLEKLRKAAARAPATVSRSASREELILEGLDALLTEASAVANASAQGAEAGPADRSRATSGTRVSAHPYQIVIYQCESCGRGEVRTLAGARRIGPAALAAASCDARIVTARPDPGGGARVIVPSIPAAVRRTVLIRDGHRCQSPGCGRTRFLELHHVVPRAEGGDNSPENLITLCSACHQLAHEPHRRE